MANKEHIEIIKRGGNAWKQWRNQNPDVQPDLRGADLRGEALNNLDLSNTLLQDAKLQKANLSNANLQGANLNNAKIRWAILNGAKLIEAKLESAELCETNLDSARLDKANLRKADLSKAVLNNAYLNEANLVGANLSNASLQRVKLEKADLTNANFEEANLAHCRLMQAKLDGANLTRVTLNGANLVASSLKGTNLSGAQLSEVRAQGVDFTSAKINNAIFTKTIADEDRFRPGQLSNEQRKQLGFSVETAVEESTTEQTDKKQTKYDEGKYDQGVYEDNDDYRNVFRENLIAFLINEKKFPRESLNHGILAEAPDLDLTVTHPDTDDFLAIFNFKSEKYRKNSTEPSGNLAKLYKESFVGKYNPFIYTVYPSEESNEDFVILEVEDDGTSYEMSHEDFPAYNQLLFASPLSNPGRRICWALTRLAKDKHGFSVHTPCRDYIDLQIKKNKRTAAQIHRLEDSDDNIALALAGYQKDFPEPKLPNYMSEGEVKRLSGYTSKSSGEKNWLEGNLGHQQLKYEAGVYILRPGVLVDDEVKDEVGSLLELARENAERRSGIEPEELSAARYAVGDRETEDDNLGFGPYVEAVAEFLVHEDTQPPLTMSVEGEWGSGKSSFMRQLQKEIRRIYAEQNKGKCFIVEFDPWRHDKEEALWAAFALKFIQDSAKSLTKREKWDANYALWKQRFQWKKAWPDVVRVILISVVWILGTAAIAIGLWNGIKLGANGAVVFPKWLGSFIAVAVSGWGAFGKVKDYLGSPLAVDLKKYMKKPNYVSKISFIERFHKDFEKIVQSYAGYERVYVFVDDLDRCKVPKAAELMESINLMLSDNPKLVFIMGMDREKVAAGLVVKHEKLLPYLSSQVEAGSGSEENNRRMRGIRYGYSFIEKFIQIPFVLPIPSKDDIKNMLLEIAGASKVEDKVTKDDEMKDIVKPTAIEKEVVGKLDEDKDVTAEVETTIPSPTEVKEKDKEKARAERQEAREEVMLKFEGDDKNFRNVVLMVSEAFGNNPRRVKQFVNLFRLRIRTAASTGLITPEERRLTFVQLGKFVGIGLRRPLFIRALERNYKLLDELVDVAEKKTQKIDERIKEWAEDEKLIGLIKSGCFDEKEKKKTGEEYERFSMRGLDVEMLMKVASPVKQMETKIEEEPAKKPNVKKKKVKKMTAKKKVVRKKRDK